VNNAGQVFRLTPPSQWTMLPIQAPQARVALGAAGLYFIGKDQKIRKMDIMSTAAPMAPMVQPGMMQQPMQMPQQQFPGMPQQAVLGGGAELQLTPMPFDLDGALIDVAVGQHIWGVNAQDMVFRRDGPSWTRVEGALKQISAAADGSVYGVNASQEIWRHDNGRWSKLDGAAVHVSVGNASNVWCVNQAGQIWRRDGNSWTNIPNGAVGPAKEICVGVDGTVYCVGVNQTVHMFANGNWLPLPGAVTCLSVYDRQNIVGCNSAGQCWRLTPPSQWTQFAQQVPGVRRISIGPTGCVLVTMDQKIHKFEVVAQQPMMMPGMMPSMMPGMMGQPVLMQGGFGAQVFVAVCACNVQYIAVSHQPGQPMMYPGAM